MSNGNSQAENPAQSQADNKTDQSPVDGSTNTGAPSNESGKQETFDRAYVESLRQEAARYRTELQGVKSKLTEFETAQLSELDKAKKQATDAQTTITELQTKLRNTSIRSEVAMQAAALKIVDADAAYRLLDADEIKFNDAGEPTNIKGLLGQLVKDKPYLLAQNSVTNPPNNPSRSGATLTLDDIRKMTPAEIIANQAAVDAALKAGQ